MWRARFEYVVASGALTVVAVMVTWWSVLARRLVADIVHLQEQVHLLQTGEAIDLTEQAARMHFMVTTEFVAVAIALCSAVAALFYVVRQRMLAQVRLTRLLQFTSHELKTPIAGVRALLQTLEMGAVPPERQREFLRRGLQEVDRLDHLAETILTWQRSVTANDRLAVATYDARLLVDQVLEHRTRTGVAETVAITELPPAQVRADHDAFRVILENLLDNARKYGGGRTQLAASLTPSTWELSVRDEGAGFPSEDAERLFDPFTRSAHDGMTHGSGLGLYLSRQLALRMQGELKAHSDGPGRGAVFTFSLPLVEGAARG
jgi:two-component system phosphate regulon sensor histidine kinase PhoR